MTSYFPLTFPVAFSNPIFTFYYIKDGTQSTLNPFIADVEMEKELEKVVDSVKINISRSILNTSWFDDFTPDVEIAIFYGDTSIFRGRVKEKRLRDFYEITVFSASEEMSRSFANRIYYTKAPEEIMASVVDENTHLHINKIAGTTERPQYTKTQNYTITSSWVSYHKVTNTYGPVLNEVIRISVEAKKTTGATVYVQLKLNGVNIGTEQSTSSATFVELSQDLTVTFEEGDYIEVFAKTDASAGEIQNFKIKYDFDIQPSGITLDRFVAFDYVSSIVGKLTQLLDWQAYTDAEANIFFQPRGSSLSSREIYRYTGKSNARLGKWEYDNQNLCNYVIFKGGDVKYNTLEYFTGDASTTEFTLANRPIQVKVSITADGGKTWTEQTKTDYDVDIEAKTVTFVSPPAAAADNILVEYTYSYPIYIERGDNASIATYGSFKKHIWARWIKTGEDARAYVLDYLSAYSQPLTRNVVTVPMSWIVDLTIGENIRIQDEIEGINDVFTIQKIKMNYLGGKVDLYCGSYIPHMIIWQSQVQDRIKELDQALITTEFLQLTIQSPDGPPLTESLTLTETLTEASLSYINLNAETNDSKFDEGRGDVNDSRFDLSAFT